MKAKGQARSASALVTKRKNWTSPEKGAIKAAFISAFQALVLFCRSLTRGDVLRFACTCPWLLYFAPSALFAQSFLTKLIISYSYQTDKNI